MKINKFKRPYFKVFLESKPKDGINKFTIILTILSTAIVVYSLSITQLNRLINEKITNPAYIQSLSKNLRPYIIFSITNNNRYITRNHTTNIEIDSLSFHFGDILKDLDEMSRDSVTLAQSLTIKITPNINLDHIPILECISTPLFTDSAKRYGLKSFVFQLQSTVLLDINSNFQFRLEFLE